MKLHRCVALLFAFAILSPARAQTYPSRTAAIRTPAAPATPRINGPRIFGARPGHPFLYHLPATGERPITFSSQGLPTGLTLDAATGNITGSVAEPGTHSVTFTATNARGADTAQITLVIGPTICLTPPLGWNSWNFFAGRVTDANIRAAADQMSATGLIDHGWTYINIDDTWEANRDPDGKILSNNKFPDMKALSDYIHAKGLKFGIYSSPGPQTCARFTASYQHEDQDAQSYADWGVDYVKYDLCSYGTIIAQQALDRYAALLSPEDGALLKNLSDQRSKIPGRGRGRGRGASTTQTSLYQSLTDQINALEKKLDPEKKKQIDLVLQQEPYTLFRTSLDKVNRDIVYSFCQYGNANVWTWGSQAGGNLWRTTGDISANWRSMSNIGFRQNDLAPYAGPGHWNDPDMLEVGNGSLTPDENYTHMTLWCMLSAPLLIGCDMPHMDDFTTSLFTNDEVLAIDQDALGKQATRLIQNGTQEIWSKPLANGDTALALFNRGADPVTFKTTWSDLKQTGTPKARDLWRQIEIPTDSSGLTIHVYPHGAELVRITP